MSTTASMFCLQPFEEEKVTSIDDDLIETSDPVRKIILDSDSDPLLDQSNDVLVISEEKLDKDEDPVSTPAPGAMVCIKSFIYLMKCK